MANNYDNYDVYKKRPDFLGVAAYHSNADVSGFLCSALSGTQAADDTFIEIYGYQAGTDTNHFCHAHLVDGNGDIILQILAYNTGVNYIELPKPVRIYQPNFPIDLIAETNWNAGNQTLDVFYSIGRTLESEGDPTLTIPTPL